MRVGFSRSENGLSERLRSTFVRRKKTVFFRNIFILSENEQNLLVFCSIAS